MSIKTHRVLLHFKIEDTITESVHILANLNYGNWVFYLLGVWFSSEVLDFFLFLICHPPPPFSIQSIKNIQRTVPQYYFFMARTRGVK